MSSKGERHVQHRNLPPPLPDRRRRGRRGHGGRSRRGEARGRRAEIRQGLRHHRRGFRLCGPHGRARGALGRRRSALDRKDARLRRQLRHQRRRLLGGGDAASKEGRDQGFAQADVGRHDQVGPRALPRAAAQNGRRWEPSRVRIHAAPRRQVQGLRAALRRPQRAAHAPDGGVDRRRHHASAHRILQAARRRHAPAREDGKVRAG